MLECSSGDYFHGNCTRICDTCQVSSCTLYCHTDSAHLCTSCDERIHAKNSIASRHEHLLICTVCENAPAAPISSFFHGSSASNLYDPTVQETDEEIGQDETDSWLLLDPDNNENQDYNDFSHCRMSDEYLDLMGHTSCIEYQYNQNQPINTELLESHFTFPFPERKICPEKEESSATWKEVETAALLDAIAQ